MPHGGNPPKTKINILKSLSIWTNDKEWQMDWNSANFYIKHTPDNGQCPKEMSATVSSHYKMASPKINNDSQLTP